MRGSRVQAVVNELQGEKIDIVNWSEDPAIVSSQMHYLQQKYKELMLINDSKKKIRCYFNRRKFK